MHLSILPAAVILSTLLFAVTGCGSSPQNSEPANSQSAADDHGHDDGQSEAIAGNFAQLSPEDQESAKAQKICPVTDEPLGSMGTPIKVEVKDKTVWVCCKGCVQSVQENPDKYLAKVEKS